MRALPGKVSETTFFEISQIIPAAKVALQHLCRHVHMRKEKIKLKNGHHFRRRNSICVHMISLGRQAAASQSGTHHESRLTMSTVQPALGAQPVAARVEQSLAIT